MTNPPIERWRRIEELLALALDREPAARARFLDAACAGDSDLRREVDSLLAAYMPRFQHDFFASMPAAEEATE